MKSLEQSQQALKNGNDELLKEKEELGGQNKALTETNQKLTAEKQKLEGEKENLTKANADLEKEKERLDKEKAELTEKDIASQKQVNELKNSQQALNNEKIELSKEITKLSTAKDELTKEKDDLTTNLSNAKSQLNQTSQKLNDLQQKHAPYDKLEKLYEVFLEVKECLIFEFVKDTHSAMDLIGYVLSDSKYYVEELYKKTQQELRNKNSDKGEKLVALFDLLFECIKDKKFKRLETPSFYNSACITLYPEQSSTGNIQRVVLRGYSYNDKTTPSIVDMGG